MFRTAFRAAFGALLGLAALVSPAAASQVIYTLTGNTSTGAAFTVTGTGDTTSLFSFLGNVNTPTVALTSNTITVGANSGTISSGPLYFFDNHTVGVAGFNLGLSSDLLDFGAAGFSTYDVISNFGPTPASLFLGANINTSFGNVDFANATNLSFSAVVGGAVPEPGTWAMMLLGFGAIGLSVRRHQRVLA